ncbi:hypothetical protein LOTGIDRAFT_236771 [Lottia gigantea]|uniref:Peptidase M12B domain-containing protein n=1 Tax=Lottia gigantea TaxID=225164 RepID=V3ZG91_LOTGI|nr:hypothetical protein LOTGIDRAFT_236771 [Lottia gigantea]ESO83172.1 hypothetical protein LOTGIDRAFT_236771 [Lottia gigantea]
MRFEIFVCFAALVAANVLGNEENGYMKIRLLSTSASDYTREKRAAGHMPEHLAFEVDSPLEKHVLRLTRSSGIPTYIASESGTAELTNDARDHALYVDRSRRSVVMVKRSAPGTDKYTLTGQIQLADSLVHIEPSKRSKRSDEDDTSLGSDEVIEINPDGIHSVLKASPIDLSDDERTPDRKKRNVYENMKTYVDDKIRRVKRQTSVYTVELCMIADFSVYSYYLTKNSNNAALANAEIEKIYSYYAEQIKVRYDNVNEVDSSIDINIVISGLVILTTAAQSAPSENNKDGVELDSGVALDAIDLFVVNPPAGVTLPPSDHYMFFTKLDLRSPGSAIGSGLSNTGLAGVGTLCDSFTSSNSATSIVEDDLTAGVGAVAAHELGHGLSGRHDDPANGCTETSNDNYVMSAVLNFPDSVALGSRPWFFSQCSINFFKTHLASANCVADNSYGGGSLIPSDLAGQALNADDQCRERYGASSYLCRTVNDYTDADGFADLCFIAFCSTGGTCRAIFPQRYTTCGNKKWCIEGTCVASAAAPATAGNLGYVQIKLLSTSASDYTREKRAAGHMPEHLAFEVDSPLEKHVLRLTRSSGIPTYIASASGTTELTNDARDHAVYVDRSRRSVVMVKRSAPSTDKYTLTGELQLADTMVHIEPSSRPRRSENVSQDLDEKINEHSNPEGLHTILKASPIYHGNDAREKADRKKRNVFENMKTYVDDKIRRVKRQTSVYTVELCIIADFSVYSHFFGISNDIALTFTAIRNIYSFYAEQIKVRYDNVNKVDSTIDINIVISGLVILAEASLSGFSETNKNGNELDAGVALDAFDVYVVNPPTGVTLPLSDHYMVFTRYDLTSTGSTPPNANAGLANLGTLCDQVTTTNEATSIVEDYNTAGVGAIAAHELGHGLSAEHDDPTNGCMETTGDNFVMSAVLSFPDSVAVGNRPWVFSGCSINFFKTYLSSANCVAGNNYGDGELVPDVLAGQFLNSDMQCKRRYGQASYFCRNVETYQDADGFVEMCYTTYCFIGDGCSAIFPQRYTTCGNKKWCIEGQCVQSAMAPETPGNSDTCPQGDQSGSTCTDANCLSGDLRCCGFCAITIDNTSPVTSPATSPVTSPATSPITSPVTSPITSPVINPITSPVTSPITSQTTSPTTSIASVCNGVAVFDWLEDEIQSVQF